MTREDVEREIERARTANRDLIEGPERPGTTAIDELAPKLDGADLRGADLSGLDLTDAGLRHADLRGAILEETVLAGAYLNHADLTGTDRTADADLSGATLHFAHLEAADLGGAKLEPAYADCMFNATYDDETRWPRGFDPETYGAKRVGRVPRRAGE